jgi:hypothetical protein
MTTGATVLSTRVATGRPFYLFMSLVLAAIAILGFSKTVPFDLTIPGFPVVLWVHAAAFTAWVLLSVAQPALIMNRSVRLHRQLGWAGAVLACAMITLGTIAILLGLWADKVPPFYPHGLFITRGAIGLLTFGGLVAAGVINRRRGEWHKRFMLCASIVVVLPGLERAMPLPLFGVNWPYAVDATIDLVAFAGPAFDFIQRRRIHPAYLWGVGAIILGQLVVYIIAPSSIATAMLHAVGAK